MTRLPDRSTVPHSPTAPDEDRLVADDLMTASGQTEILDGLRSFVASVVVPLHEKCPDVLEDPRGRYTTDGRYSPEAQALMRQVRMQAAQAGYYTMLVAEELGGGGLGPAVLYDVWEDLHRHFGPKYWLAYHVVAHWAKGASPALSLADPDYIGDFLGDLLSGEKTMCFAMSEPDAGSDAWRMRTRAEPLPDGGWAVTGTKQWISNGTMADYALVLAVTDPTLAESRRGGVTAFLVDTSCPGFHVDSSIRMFGELGGNEAILSFDEMKVYPHQVVGEVDGGFAVGLGNVATGRIYNAGKAVGLARWGLTRAVGYVQERQAFGSSISKHQGVMFPLVESAFEVAAAHALGVRCVRRHEMGLASGEEIAMAKAYSTEAGVRALDRVIQSHGAMGFTNELGLTEAWQMLRLLLVADGTAEILRRAVSRALLAGTVAL
jgi:acyl-CoA dehydrogenase